MYGYSAGGQCAALFSAFMKGEVAAWGAHGCGVYPDADLASHSPALITCGEEDSERFAICRQFAYRRRESGGNVLFKGYGCGHHLNRDALDLASAWLAAFSGKTPSVKAWGEDDTQRVLPVSRIDREFRNPLYSSDIERLWKR
jgi:pimeloyl-ACP methyl ester carboxylesterase